MIVEQIINRRLWTEVTRGDVIQIRGQLLKEGVVVATLEDTGVWNPASPGDYVVYQLRVDADSAVIEVYGINIAFPEQSMLIVGPAAAVEIPLEWSADSPTTWKTFTAELPPTPSMIETLLPNLVTVTVLAIFTGMLVRSME